MTNLPVLDMAEALFRANVFHLMPGYPPEGHSDLYQKVLATQHLAVQQYHASTGEAMDRLLSRWKDPLEQIRSQPGIIATFHTGSYRLLSLCLLRSGLPVALVVSGEVAGREREQMHQRHREMDGSGYAARPLMILEAEDPLVVRKMCRLVAAGYYLLLYVDGNTGVATDERARSLIISFMSGHLRVRQGIGIVSHLAGVPIYPVLTDTVSERTNLILMDTITPAAGMDRSSYADQATRQLYQHLEQSVRQSPGSWECWRYVHQWMVLDAQIGIPGLHRMNLASGSAGRWLVFRQGEQRYLLDASRYTAYQFA